MRPLASRVTLLAPRNISGVVSGRQPISSHFFPLAATIGARGAASVNGSQQNFPSADSDLAWRRSSRTGARFSFAKTIMYLANIPELNVRSSAGVGNQRPTAPHDGRIRVAAARLGCSARMQRVFGGRTWAETPALPRAAGRPRPVGRSGLSGPSGPTWRRRGGSRPISRVLSRATIHLGRTSPCASSDLPGSPCGQQERARRPARFPIWSCSRWGLPCRRMLPPARCALTAPFHPYLPTALLRRHRRFAFCCTFRGLAPPRRYLAPCPVEPGLSSAS